LLVMTALLTACGQVPVPPAKPLVVASFYPLYEFARQVAGEQAEVRMLVPHGMEPHDWEPSPQDLALLRKARLFVYNGAGFEPWEEHLRKDRAGSQTAVMKATTGIALRAAAWEGPGDKEKEGHGHGDEKKKTMAEKAAEAPPDPHVWLDPVRARSQVEAIRAGLAQADPANAAAYAENAKAYDAKLAALHEAFERGLAQCARREIIVSHAAFGYLTDRYRLTMVPIAGLRPEAEPSPAQLGALVRLVRRTKVKYIFFETLVGSKVAETLAREVGAQTLVLNPIEGLTKEEEAAGKGYVSLMEENLKNLRTALQCT
jgi:zinc transport system substrate-binding protein